VDVSLPDIAFTIVWNWFRSWLPKMLTMPIPATATSATMMMYSVSPCPLRFFPGPFLISHLLR